jgi:hypothetical protein
MRNYFLHAETQRSSIEPSIPNLAMLATFQSEISVSSDVTGHYITDPVRSSIPRPTAHLNQT